MTNRTNLKRRGARYHFRVRVPADLAGRFGRIELARTLNTADPAEARRRALHAAHATHSLFDHVRNDPSMTKDQIDALVRDFTQGELAEYRQLAKLAPLTPRAADAKEHADATRPRIMRMLASDLAACRTTTVQAALDDLIERRGVAIERGGAVYHELASALAAGWFDTLEAIEAGVDLEAAPAPTPAPPAPAPVAPPAPAAPSRALSPDGMKSLSALLPDFLKKRGITERSEKEVHVAVRMIEDFFGYPKPICEITKRDFIEYRKLLEDTPTNAQQRFPGKSLREAVELNKKRTQPFDTLGAKVINDKWLAHIKTMLNRAVNDYLIPDSPAIGVKVEVGKRAANKDARHPFSDSQLHAIFNARPFTGCKSEGRLFDPGSYRVRDHRLWATLLALFSGARPSEIAQVEMVDVVQREGIWLLSITDQSDDDDDRGKSLKTDNARRLIPIHPELQRLGFMEHIEAERARGGKRLFSTWEAAPSGDYIATFPRWFNRTFLPKIGMKTDKTVFYSFRHNFRDAMRRAGLTTDLQNALFGHADTTTGAIYGHGAKILTPRQLFEAMAAVKYDGLDLAHLRT